MIKPRFSPSVSLAIISVAMWSAIAAAEPSPPQPQRCTAKDFASAVDTSGAALRAFTLEAQPKIQDRMRRYREVMKLDTDDYESAAIDAIQDEKLADFDEKSAAMLLRINNLGRVAEGTPPDCGKLAEIASLSRDLLTVMREKANYMLARLDAKISAAGGTPAATAEATTPLPAKPAPAKAAPEKPAVAKTETAKPKPAEPKPAEPREQDAYVPPSTPPAPPIPVPPPLPNVAVDPEGYSIDEIRDATRGFFGTVSTSLASVLEHAFKTTGRPTAYVLGTEGGGAFFAGLRFGQGTLFMRNQAGTRPVYWHGPSLGTDFGASGSRTMFLIYKLEHPDALFRSYSGIDGSAYFVGGVGVTLLKGGDVVMAPIRSGLGLRLGANIGYLRFSPQPTWNPF
jgi:hypothetical protein